jgi:hypothetical protein
MIDALIAHPRWAHLSPEHFFVVPPGEAAIEETAVGGAGRVEFPYNRDVICALPVNDNMPLLWFTHNECADGAFIVFDAGHIAIHLVELKSAVNAGKWAKARRQFEGMLANTLALLGFLDVVRPFGVVCHLALKSESISGALRASPVLGKRLTGLPLSAAGGHLSASQQFQRRAVDILDRKGVEVRIIQRDAAGNAVSDLH